jgi:hypothetical protein
MKILGLVSLVSVLASSIFGQAQWPIHNNGLNKVVEWSVSLLTNGLLAEFQFIRDHYSHIINGQRLFIWSGEVRR